MARAFPYGVSAWKLALLDISHCKAYLLKGTTRVSHLCTCIHFHVRTSIVNFVCVCLIVFFDRHSDDLGTHPAFQASQWTRGFLLSLLSLCRHDKHFPILVHFTWVQGSNSGPHDHFINWASVSPIISNLLSCLSWILYS